MKNLRPENVIKEEFYNFAYMPGTNNDAKVQEKLKGLRHIFNLAKLVEKFELALVPYIQARAKLENTIGNIKGIVNTLFITHTEGDVVTAKFKEMFDTGLAQAVKAGNAFNWLSRFSMLVKLYEAGNYSWFSLNLRDAELYRIGHYANPLR